MPLAVNRNAGRPRYTPEVERLISKYGEDGAFSLIDRARTGGRVAESERADLVGMDLPQADREVEGGMTGLSVVPAAIGYEYGLKPAARAIPALNSILPESFQYQEGVTSDPSWGNVQAATRGALASGRVLPKAAEDWLKRAILQVLTTRNGGA